jgi:hypothetical protein
MNQFQCVFLLSKQVYIFLRFFILSACFSFTTIWIMPITGSVTENKSGLNFHRINRHKS